MVDGGLLTGRNVDDDIRHCDGLDHRQQVALGANGIAVWRIPKHHIRGQHVRNQRTHAIPIERSPRETTLLVPMQPTKGITVVTEQRGPFLLAALPESLRMARVPALGAYARQRSAGEDVYDRALADIVAAEND